jgi:hypothetical protein
MHVCVSIVSTNHRKREQNVLPKHFADWYAADIRKCSNQLYRSSDVLKNATEIWRIVTVMMYLVIWALNTASQLPTCRTMEQSFLRSWYSFRKLRNYLPWENLKVHYRVHKSGFLKNIPISSHITSRSSEWFLSIKFFNHNFVHISHHEHSELYGSKQAFPEVNVLSLSSWMQVWFLAIVPTFTAS